MYRCWYRLFLQVFYMPLALFLPPPIFLVHNQFNLIYQFWVHTEVCLDGKYQLEPNYFLSLMGSMVQRVERLTCDRLVICSNPIKGSLCFFEQNTTLIA